MTTSSTIPLSRATRSLSARRIPVKELDRRRGPYPYWGASGIVDYVDEFIFDQTTLLVSEDGENLRSRKTPIAFLASGKYWVNNHAHVLAAAPGFDLRFLFYFVSTFDFDGNGLITGSGQPKLNAANLGCVPVPKLPLAEQQRIARVLGAFDDLIETNRRLADAIAALVASTYEVELASTANRVHLSDVSRHLPGKYLPKKTYEAGGPYPVYGSNSVMGSYTSYLYAGPLTVMARIGSNCGALRLSESSAWINNNASAIKAIDPRMQVRLHEALRRVEMDNHRAGTGQPFIRTESLMGERIPWPTKPSPWDAASGDLVEVAAALEEESGDLIRQRDELLPLLMSGKVRVSEVEGVA